MARSDPTCSRASRPTRTTPRSRRTAWLPWPTSRTSRSWRAPTRSGSTRSSQKEAVVVRHRALRGAQAVPDRGHRPSRGSPRSPRSVRSAAQFDSTYAALYYPWVRIVDPNAKPDASSPPATLDLPPSGYAAGIYARSRHPARRAQGPGQRGRARHHAVRRERHVRPPVGAEPRGHQRPALLPRPGQPGLGCAHDQLGPGVEVRQRAPAVHLPRALHRPCDAVGGVRAQQRAALGVHPAERRGLPGHQCGGPAP